MKSKSGFTLVEILVVLAVIAILSTVAILGNQAVQKNSRDSKRRADIVTLANELEKYYEKNGEYPRTCTGGYLCPPDTVPRLVTSSRAASRAILPGLPNDFGDPQYTSGSFITYAPSGNDHAYFYYGGFANNTTSVATTVQTPALTLARNGGNPSSITCTYAAPSLPIGATTAYLIGYYSETDARFKIFSGGKGVQLASIGGDASCALLPSF